ncbi:hypothetical protein JCM13580A_38470 [Streptomyces drozdowiczii]
MAAGTISKNSPRAESGHACVLRLPHGGERIPSSLQSSIHQSVSIIRPGECPYEGIIKVRPPRVAAPRTFNFPSNTAKSMGPGFVAD